MFYSKQCYQVKLQVLLSYCIALKIDQEMLKVSRLKIDIKNTIHDAIDKFKQCEAMQPNKNSDSIPQAYYCFHDSVLLLNWKMLQICPVDCIWWLNLASN